MTSESALEDVCLLIADCPHKTAAESADAFAYAVGTKAVRDGRIDFGKAKPVSADTYVAWITKAQPAQGDLIFCREAPVGPVALVPDSPPVCLGQRTVLLRPDPSKIDARWLYYFLSAPRTQQRFAALAEGSTVAHLNVADVRKFEVQHPLIEEQRRISGVLGSLDAKVDANEVLAKRLADLVITAARGLDSNGLTTTFPLDEVLALHRQKTPKGSALRYLGLDQMPRGSTVLSSWKTDDAPTGESYEFAEGDLLFGKLRPYFRKAGVATFDGRCSGEILVLRPIRPELFGLGVATIASDAFISHANAVSSGTRMPRSEWQALKTFRCVLPKGPQGEKALARHTALARAVYKQVSALVAENDHLRSVRDELLPKLISGRIRVPDSYDPGDVLGVLVEQILTEEEAVVA
jgi:type I restriction enzyme S subunit